jgi:hypothetical protein
VKRSIMRGVRRALGLVIVWCLLAGSATASGVPGAHAAQRRTLHLAETARLHLVKKSNSQLLEHGPASGTLSGSVTARFRIGFGVSGTVTFKFARGTLTVTVVGYLVSNQDGILKTTGRIRVERGTGQFAHAKGSGKFNGTTKHRTWATTVDATGTITY